jgi:hypothetical protein
MSSRVSLIQRCNLLRSFQRLRFMEGRSQFILMERRSFNDKSSCPQRKLPCNECQRFYIDDGFVSSINRMEVGWRMIAKIHLNDDAIEATQFRHVWGDRLAWGKLLRGISLLIAYRVHRGKGRYCQAIQDGRLQSTELAQKLRALARRKTLHALRRLQD